MSMIQYRPWEKNEVRELITKSNEGLHILDIQLGGACNLHCIYCDTPKYGLPCSVDLSSIERLMDIGNIKWVHICGLGEPTAHANLSHLKQILQWCKEKNIKLSMFSNMLNVDKELLDYIDTGTLHVLFKLDTFNKEKMTYLYGHDKGDIILKNYELLREVTHVENGVTNLAASIVPTSVNYDELSHIIDYCMKNGYFPLIGQLEDAGNCSAVFKDLEVKEEDLINLRRYLSDTYDVSYEMPICPATISGIHITNTNQVILDERTGLSCPWFWLDEPKIKSLGDIRNMEYDEIVRKILEYRRLKLSDVERYEENIELYPFGGCGGNVKTLLKTYLDVARTRNI